MDSIIAPAHPRPDMHVLTGVLTFSPRILNYVFVLALVYACIHDAYSNDICFHT